ncbi:type II toxin-antitoxin system PemK/MazF family toxin [Haloflavibacter putidus]|uniref:mRNA interferase n=1 Tax=Haloflavibacter putidus TaxID=2576776 RepID=A0A507ZT92_9FLAO|nr:type II toxin-antitoxin system PemK/MazF family toxin [Haloflavibacter putidus]TQD39743.1 type II toxin-antitoxin system PemK/MazF family toxin [Haloflavibacter putidus]
MKQGEIWQVYFDPIRGNEQGGNRPAVVVSGNTLNKNLGVVIVCPLTSSIHNFEGNPVLEATQENGLKRKSEIMIFHIRSLSKDRFKRKLGNITMPELSQIKQTIYDILKY